jgi:hypothetical protein
MLALLAATLLAASEGPIDGARPSTFALELQTGSEPPIGLVSLSGVYGPVDWLSLGAGIGTGERQPNYGLFARWYPLRRGAFKLGPAVGATRGERRRYSQPQDYITWTWEPMYRLDVGVGVEAKSGRLKARLESGVGFLLGEPVCLYLQGAASEGSCRSPFIPEQFHEAPSSVRMPVYLALSIGQRLNQPERHQAGTADAHGGAPNPIQPGRRNPPGGQLDQPQRVWSFGRDRLHEAVRRGQLGGGAGLLNGLVPAGQRA